MKTEFSKYKNYVQREIELSARIAEQSMEDRIYFISKIRELKGILRIPRLYKEYKKQLEEANRLNEITEFQLENYTHGVSQIKPEQNQISQFET